MSEQSNPIRILHVDDEPELAELAAIYLHRADSAFEIESATDASEGLDRLENTTFDCIVSDHDMPGQNGIEFLKTVRENHPNLPFILFTGKGSEELASDAISAGVTDYLQKGGGTDQYTVLANRIRNVVEKWRAEQEIERTRARLEAITGNSNDTILTIDAESTIRFVNQSAKELFGVEPERLIGESLTTVMPPRYRDAHLAAVEQYLNTGERTMDWKAVELSAQHWDGHEIPVSVSFNTFEEDGERRFVGVFRDISDRVRMEADLREREQQFRQLAENIHEVVWMSDSETEALIFVNPAYEEIWGKSMDSLYENPESYRDSIHPADYARVKVEIDERTTDPYEVEYRIIRPDGETRRILDRAVPVTNDAGEIYRIVGIASDITSRTQHAARLEESTSRLEALFEYSPDMINVHDADGNIIDPNPSLCEETGYESSELVGMKVWELDQTLDPAESRALWAEMEVGERREFEGVFKRRDGSEFPVKIHVRQLDTDEGDRFAVISRDITEQKARERDLQQERDRFSSVFEKAFDAMVIADDDGRYIDVNESAAELFGLPAEALIGRSIEEFAPEGFDFEMAWSTFQASDRARGEFPLVRPDGTVRTVEYSATPNIVDGQHLSVLRDRTDQEKQKRKLERQNERLEEFASVVSHDLRNPLNIANGNLELAREECESPHLSKIADAHRRMEALIEDLLVLAKQGQPVGALEPVPLGEIVSESWANVETGEATVDVQTDRSIYADRSRLRQLLENLIRNSIEHGDADVTVTVGPLENGFFVEDDGPGIPERDRHEIFSPGYTTHEDGTGFGLSIVNEITKAHDWTIRVTEADGGGARFEVTDVEFIE